MSNLLVVFIALSLGKFALEWWLRLLNRRYYLDPKRQQDACATLGISATEFAKTLAYSNDKFRFGTIALPLQTLTFLLFVGLGGFGYIEGLATTIASHFGGGEISIGLVFFGILGLLSSLASLPFDLYSQFVIEEKHGFNRQKIRGFFADLAKGFLITALLGGPLCAAILWIMERSGDLWWLWAWALLTGFSIFASWLFPAVLAPLFNKFTPLGEGPLKEQIFALARQVNFKTSHVFVMDASRRSSHGNAYFTGLFREKRIVLFDTLLNDLNHQEVVAVLAHELGHFKLKHVFWGMVRGIVLTGVLFFLLSLCLPLKDFYTAFYFNDVSSYAALVVFSLWYGIIGFALMPLQAWVSRKNEFSADRFAVEQLKQSKDLRQALIKLCETNHAMPLTHPLYSSVYNSHPPLLERLQAMKA